jgi:hypothetical protein
MSGAPADSVPSAQPTPNLLPTQPGSALYPSPPDLRGFAPPFTLMHKPTRKSFEARGTNEFDNVGSAMAKQRIDAVEIVEDDQ